MAEAGRDSVYKALSDPTRREILRLLRDGEKTAGQLANRFPISGPSMSHHFGLLKQADLIASRRDGQQIYYSLNTTVVQDVIVALFDLIPADIKAGKGPLLPQRGDAGREE